MKQEIIDIIGAGIGGLTAAIALKKKGFSVRIFEQSEGIFNLQLPLVDNTKNKRSS